MLLILQRNVEFLLVAVQLLLGEVPVNLLQNKLINKMGKACYPVCEGHMPHQVTPLLHLLATCVADKWSCGRNVRKLGEEVAEDVLLETAFVLAILATLVAINPTFRRARLILSIHLQSCTIEELSFVNCVH